MSSTLLLFHELQKRAWIKNVSTHTLMHTHTPCSFADCTECKQPVVSTTFIVLIRTRSDSLTDVGCVLSLPEKDTGIQFHLHTPPPPPHPTHTGELVCANTTLSKIQFKQKTFFKANINTSNVNFYTERY